AVPGLEAPDPAGDADVEEVEAARREPLGALHRVAEIRVASVDEHVALARVAHELIEGVIGDVSRGDHRPQRARWPEGLHHLLDAVGADGTLGLLLIDGSGAAVAGDDAMTAAQEARHHVPAHPPEPVQTDVHRGHPSRRREDMASAVW